MSEEQKKIATPEYLIAGIKEYISAIKYTEKKYGKEDAFFLFSSVKLFLVGLLFHIGKDEITQKIPEIVFFAKDNVSYFKLNI